MPKIAMVAALEREVDPLVHAWPVRAHEHSGRCLRFFEKDDVVVVCGGIGSEAARRAAEAAIALYHPQLLYSVGFAGALHTRLKVGDVFEPGGLIDAGDSSRVPLAGGDGILVSFREVADPAQKARLRQSLGADAVDMEAAAVGRAAEARGVEFRVMKAISDGSDFEFPSTARFIGADGRFRTGRFVWFAAWRPWLWGRVIRLARNTRRASRALCAGLSGEIARIAAQVEVRR
jgi:adenosylhomocysteine nucleosidase